jgi:hypothetical protein
VFWGFGLPTPRTRTKSEVKAERERLGIIPAKAQKVVEQVARQEHEEPENEWLPALHAALERKNIAYRALYAELLKQEIHRIQAQEEEEIALVLLMH